MSDENIQPSDLLGKKVFFLYPTASIQNQIITELVQQEYEVYTCRDQMRLMHVLKKYPDSIVFVNIDDGVPEAEWEKWISTLSTALPLAKVGIFSSSNDEQLKDKYVNILHVSCGFMALKVDMSKAIPVILEILKVMNAKGRRKYLRATTERETAATMNMPLRGEIFNGVIKDISVVGFSCAFEYDIGLTKNALLKDIQIRLQSMLLKVEAIVFGSRMDDNEKIYVMIFTQRIDPEVRVKIRKYIQQNLQSKMDVEISTT
jgi:hypothetical protein